MVAAIAAAGALFFVLWWMLQSQENAWLPAGLAASVVILVAAFAREVVMRRISARYILEVGASKEFERATRSRTTNVRRAPTFSQTEALRVLERKSAEANDENSLPEAHLNVYQLCGEFLETAERSLASPTISAERRLTVRARQERVQILQKHHLLSWARDSARSLTHQAQQRPRLHEKIETANRALDCIESALATYPDNEELQGSAAAVRDFITTSRVAHWVELGQRAAFKGRYRRAIDCYSDALFFLTRASAERQPEADRIAREIELLRARIETTKAVEGSPSDKGRRSPRD
jgi:hypothetical protein